MPFPWEGPKGGDHRLKTLVPLLVPVGSRAKLTDCWDFVSSHLPGCTGKECLERWTHLHLAASSDA